MTNTKFTNGGKALPPAAKGWNWGAFLLSWIWGLGNKTYLALLALIPGINIIIAVLLGIKGNEWAWKNRGWKSVEQFTRVQKTWSVFGLGMLAGILLGIICTTGLVAMVVVNVFL